MCPVAALRAHPAPAAGPWGTGSLQQVGSFYTNVTLVGAPAKKVTRWLSRRGRSGFVASDDRYTVVFDQLAEAQDGTNAALARDLSSEFRCPTVAVTNHDDDVLYVDVYDSGMHVDHYDSAPGYFTWDGEGDPPEPEGGRAVELARLFGADAYENVEEVLRAAYDFEHDRHLALISSLRLSPLAHGAGYDYLAAGDYPPGAVAATFVRF